MKIDSITDHRKMAEEIKKDLATIPYVAADSFAFAADPNVGVVGIQFNMKDEKGTLIKFAMTPTMFLDWAKLVGAHLLQVNQEIREKKSQKILQ